MKRPVGAKRLHGGARHLCNVRYPSAHSRSSIADATSFLGKVIAGSHAGSPSAHRVTELKEADTPTAGEAHACSTTPSGQRRVSLSRV